MNAKVKDRDVKPILLQSEGNEKEQFCKITAFLRKIQIIFLSLTSVRFKYWRITQKPRPILVPLTYQ